MILSDENNGNRLRTEPTGLNPCFNGWYSLTETKGSWAGKRSECLNPCFNGWYSLTRALFADGPDPWVLILVLMDDTLWLV